MNIGFIGLGRMGWPIAKRLMVAGHYITVYDAVRDAPGAMDLRATGAEWAESPKQVARDAEIVFTSLPGPDEVREVALGDNSILDGASRDSVYIDLTTNSPRLIRRIHGIYRKCGVGVLDAPVSQSTDTRDRHKGTLTIMIGGDRDVYERVKPVLSILGSELLYCGKSGSGALCKVINNVHLFTIHAALAEALTLGVKAGVPIETLTKAISLSSARSRPSEVFTAALHEPRFLDNPEGPMVATGLKDVRLAIDLGSDLGVPMELADVAAEALSEAVDRGWGGMQYSAHVQVREINVGADLEPKEPLASD
ncbi:MAG: NAD(P)-dependent oxidoreductase [SAR202 cluster bacterium]|nr:NAD(P)-dependent oxidoreductase [SAR202 cluster bacterium]